MIKLRLAEIQHRIKEAAISFGRNPEHVKLVAVSKTMPVEKVKSAIEAGVSILGENYIQEAKEKISIISGESPAPVSWHFIGHLQSNKAKYAVKLFDLIHSVDRFNLAKEINQQAEKINKVQNILIQVNIGNERSKSGISEDNSLDLIKTVCDFKNLSVKGLMTMPPFYNDPENVRPFFSALNRLREKVSKMNIPNIQMNELSMGMTGDFEVAIEEGATLVRIGTAIFGKRS